MIEIETERLLIRNFRHSDWEALYRMIVQYQASPLAAYDYAWPTSPEEIRGVAEWFASGDSFLAVCLRESGPFMGLVSLNPEAGDERREYDLGYVFDADYHGHGYATEACGAVLRYALGDLHADRVVAGTAAANRPSCRLLQRLGFTKTDERVGSFRNTPDGRPIEFLGYVFVLSKDDLLQ